MYFHTAVYVRSILSTITLASEISDGETPDNLCSKLQSKATNTISYLPAVNQERLRVSQSLSHSL